MVQIGSEYLFAEDLRDTVQFMKDNQMYDKMVIYTESPESASMFEGMGYEDLRVYGVSSSDSQTTQWGAYCTPDELVEEKHIKTCMTDLFSAIWLEDLGKNSDSNTLQDQFDRIKGNTPKLNIE